MSKAPLSANYTESDEIPEKHGAEAEPRGRVYLCCKSVLTTTCQAFLQLALAVSFIVIGVKYRNDCPVQEWIPIYLIVVGAGTLLMFLVTCMWHCYQTRRDATIERGEVWDTGCFCKWLIVMRYILIVLMFVFTKAWFIGGTVLVFSVHGKTSTDEDSPLYCHDTLYKFSFITLLIGWSIVGIMFLIFMCFCCIGSCFGAAFVEDLEETLPWERRAQFVTKKPAV